MEDVFITKIEINKVRHLQGLAIDLSETERKHLVLTGRNGSGKTSLLEVMKDYFLFPFSSQYKENFFFLSNPNNDIPFTATVLTKKQTSIMSEMMKRIVSEIKIFCCAPHVSEFGFSLEDILVVFIPAQRTILNIPDPKSIENVKLDKTYSIDRDASMDFLQYMIDLDYQKLSAESDSDKKETLRINNWFINFEKTLREIYENNSLELKRYAKEKSFKICLPDREPFGLNQVADGYSALLKIVIEIMMRMENQIENSYNLPCIILIDEIEAHLHVELQKKVLPILTTTFPKAQFIVTTHSPFVISSLENAVVYDLEKQCRLEDMSAYSYDGIVEYYYNSEKYSDKAKANLEEYKELTAKNNRSEKENERLAELTLYFDSTPILGSPQIMNAFLETEMNRRNSNHG
jgi:predicted ATP-binding protein involved in virulence